MGQRHGNGVARMAVLAVVIAVLLPAGMLAAATVGPGAGAGRSGRVDAAGLGGEPVTDPAPIPAAPAPPSVVVTSTSAPPPTTPIRPTTRSATTAMTVPPIATTSPVPPSRAPTTTSTPATQTSSWSLTKNGITVRVHMEPTMPMSGQPVTFVVDEVTAPPVCCVIHVAPEVGTILPLPGAGGPNPEMKSCDSPPETRSGSVTHTFTTPGVYPVLVIAIAGNCLLSPTEPVRPTAVAADLLICIAVGPGTPVPPRCPEPVMPPLNPPR